MKKILIAVCLAAIKATVAQEIVEVSSKIEEVTLFKTQAQVKRTATKFLNAGHTVVVFNQLSADLDPASIQVSGQGAFTILDVKHQFDYLNAEQLNPSIKPLRDSLIYYQQELKLAQKISEVYNSEKNMILNNNQVNNDSGFDIEDLDDLAIYYRSRLTDIAQKTIENENKIQYLNRRISTLKKQLQESGWGKPQKRSKILVEVSSKIKTAAKINLSYNVYQAGWQPGYEIKVNEIGEPVTVNFVAYAYQKTQEAWENVKLTLSTGNPLQNNNIPKLNPIKIYTYEPRPVRSNGKGYAPSQAAQKYTETAVLQVFEDKEQALETSDFTEYTENYTLSVYEISIPFTIHPDGKTQKIPIQTNNISAEYQYVSIPIKSEKAYLAAKIPNWENYAFQPGEARIYFQDTYVGKTYINPNSTQDTLLLSLGVDDGIKVSRKRQNQYRDKKVVSGNIKETFGYEISIRNNKKNPVNIQIKDAIPISTTDEVSVDIIDLGGATHNSQTGILTWNVHLNPGEKTTLKFAFSVKYPKDKNINIY